MLKTGDKNAAALRSKLLQEYLTFLQDHQCAAQSTIAIRCNHVAEFLAILKKDRAPSRIRHLQAHTIHDYIIKTARPLGRAKRKHLVSSLRSFLRFAHFRGYLNRSLVEAVPMIRTYKLATIPRAISWDSVKKLLSAPDRRTRPGRRDYAILQLLATYGIRIGQALSLKLCDIKWHEGMIHFQASKGGKPLCFPLQKQVASALLAYIRKDRDKVSFPRVFLSVKGKLPRPLAQNTKLWESLNRYFKLANIKSPGGVSHPIRHAFAIRLMEQGTPIKTIADLLGHRSITNTFIYTKADIPRLRSLAREWPEETP